MPAAKERETSSELNNSNMMISTGPCGLLHLVQKATGWGANFILSIIWHKCAKQLDKYLSVEHGRNIDITGWEL